MNFKCQRSSSSRLVFKMHSVRILPEVPATETEVFRGFPSPSRVIMSGREQMWAYRCQWRSIYPRLERMIRRATVTWRAARDTGLLVTDNAYGRLHSWLYSAGAPDLHEEAHQVLSLVPRSSEQGGPCVECCRNFLERTRSVIMFICGLFNDARIMWRGILRWLMNNELEGMWQEAGVI
jgi:hypothetical protein